MEQEKKTTSETNNESAIQFYPYNEYRQTISDEIINNVGGKTFIAMSSESTVKASTAGRKCVIMLALSLYPRSFEEKIELSKSKYRVEGNEKNIYDGHYQLEVIPKYIMDTLEKESFSNVEFILIETKAIYHKEKSKPVYIKSGDDEPRQCFLIDKNNEKIHPNEADFFVNKMIQYNEHDLGNKFSKGNIRFVEYHLQNDSGTDMSNLLELVRKECGVGENAARLYIDIHGGQREIQLLLTNLLSTLRAEGITINPNDILTVAGPNSPITNAGESFKINDFVSGIHEFVNYGRMESLNRFYSQNESTASENLRNVMRDVSSAIQLCDMGRFEKLLETLADELTNFKKSNSENNAQGRDYLSSFVNLIVNGYKGLIKETADAHYEHSTEVWAEIEWCREKGLYQQMLTICEGIVPKYLSDTNIIEYEEPIEKFADKNKKKFEREVFLFNNIMSKINTPRKDGKYKTELSKEKQKLDIEVQLDNSCSSDLEKMLTIHFNKLKKERNLSNHGSREPRTSIEELTHDIEDYVKLLKNFAAKPDKPLIKVKLSAEAREKEKIGKAIKEYSNRLKEAESIADISPSEITETPFSDLHNLLCTAATTNTVDKRVQIAKKNPNAKCLLIKIFEMTNQNKYPATDDKWLREMCLKDGTNTDRNKPFWKKVGESLSSLQRNDDFRTFVLNQRPLNTPQS